MPEVTPPDAVRPEQVLHVLDLRLLGGRDLLGPREDLGVLGPVHCEPALTPRAPPVSRE